MLTFENDISTSATSTVSSWPQRPQKRDQWIFWPANVTIKIFKNRKYYINYVFNNSFFSGGGTNFIGSSFLTGNVFNKIYLRVHCTSVSIELEGVLYLIIIVAKHWNKLMNIIFAKSSTKFIWAIILLIFITFAC